MPALQLSEHFLKKRTRSDFNTHFNQQMERKFQGYRCSGSRTRKEPISEQRSSTNLHEWDECPPHVIRGEMRIVAFT
eukprot:9283050-Pyramimonas_sp.AAC.1